MSKVIVCILLVFVLCFLVTKGSTEFNYGNDEGQRNEELDETKQRNRELQEQIVEFQDKVGLWRTLSIISASFIGLAVVILIKTIVIRRYKKARNSAHLSQGGTEAKISSDKNLQKDFRYNTKELEAGIHQYNGKHFI